MLAAVKAWPGNAGNRGIETATAILDGGCARRPSINAGRDEETAPGSNKETGKKEGPHLGASAYLNAPLYRAVLRFRPGNLDLNRSGQLMCYQNRTT